MQTPQKKNIFTSLSVNENAQVLYLKTYLKLVTVFKNNGYNYAPDPIL